MYAKDSSLKLPTTKYVLFDVETHGLEASYDPTKDVYCVCLYIVDENGLPSIVKYLSAQKAIAKLQELLDNGWALFAHNAKYDYSVLKVRGLQHTIAPGILSVGCTQLMAYIKDSTLPSYSLDALTGAKTDVIAEFTKAGLVSSDIKKTDFWRLNWKYNKKALDIIVRYCVDDIKATASLYRKLAQWFNANPRFINPLLQLEFPMLEVLTTAETAGANINTDELYKLRDDLTKALADARQVITDRYQIGLPKLTWHDEESEYLPVVKEYKETGYSNPKNISHYMHNGILCAGYLNSKTVKNSKTKQPQQTYTVYSHCPLTPYNSASATGHNWWLLSMECPEVLELADVTKTGRPKLDKDFYSDVAEQIPGHLPIAAVIKYAKYLTIAEGLIKHIVNGRIHPNFNNTKTRTTRLATNNPNLQNITRPLDDKHPDYKTERDWGMRFRSLFSAPEGKVILCADLDRIEIVVLAWFLFVLEKDDGLLKVVNSGADVHQNNADIWGLTRNLAKTLIFLLVYGGTPKLIYKRGMTKTLAEAEAAFDSVNQGQPSIAKLKKKVWAKIRKAGFISNPFDAHGLYPELNAKKKWVVGRGERMSFNYLIQKTARDIIHLLVIHSLPTIRRFGGIVFNIIHDECLVEVDAGVADKLIGALNGIWENRFDILPGIRVNGSWNKGSNWYEAK